MDVRCGRCATEYEFDDALISERGTTVKCTNCGYQFRIFPIGGSARAPERWVVRTGIGRELVFTSLRDLQRGIAQRQVGPQDLLSRGNQPARPLGSIAELEPFFRVGEGGLPSVPAPVARDAAPAPRDSFDTPERIVAPVAPVARSAPPAPAQEAAPSWRPPPSQRQAPAAMGPGSTGRVPVAGGPGNTGRPPAAAALGSERMPLPSEDDMDGPTLQRSTPPAGFDERDLQAELDDAEYEEELAVRRRRSRTIVGVVLGLAVLLCAAVFGRSLLGRLAKREPVANVSDARAADRVERGQRLLEMGDFEAAKEELDKASALSERDVAVLGALARLEATRADALWLKLRLLDPKDATALAQTRGELERRVAKASDALDRLAALVPKDAQLARGRVDLARMGDDLAKASSAASALGDASADPETAYSLAAMELAEQPEVNARTLERLRAGAAGSHGASRARSVLVYALAKGGALEQASSELSKLAAEAKQHPLLAELRAFIERQPSAVDAGSEHDSLAAIDVSKLPKLGARTGSSSSDDEPALAGDFRAQLQQAGKALASGNLDRAERLYHSVLQKHPDNTEALAGLGDVARRRKDPATATQMYERVLKDNPSYLPALMASADQKWESGDRKGALVLYRRVLEQAEASSAYGQRAASRIAAGDKPPAENASSQAPAPEPPRESKPAEAPKTEPPKEEAPAIDTTDLPEVNR